MLAAFKRWLVALWVTITTYFWMLIDDDWAWDAEYAPPRPRRKRGWPRPGPSETPEDLVPVNRDERRAIKFRPHTFAQPVHRPARGFRSESEASRDQHMASASRTLNPTRANARGRGRV